MGQQLAGNPKNQSGNLSQPAPGQVYISGKGSQQRRTMERKSRHPEHSNRPPLVAKLARTDFIPVVADRFNLSSFPLSIAPRSEERRVGKECSSGWFGAR